MQKYKSFQQIVDAYIVEKRSIGLKFDKGAQVLRRIVALQMQLDRGVPLLSRKTVETWTEKTPWESEVNRSHRICIIRGLGKYMVGMGYTAYIVPDRLAPFQDYIYAPYISSDKELGLLLASVDALCKQTPSEHASLVFPLLFRMLVGCGLRITEALSIEKQDVDLENGTLLLLNAKK